MKERAKEEAEELAKEVLNEMGFDEDDFHTSQIANALLSFNKEKVEDRELVASVLRIENKKLGGTLSEICKLLKDSKVEKKYFDQTDIKDLEAKLTKAREGLKDINSYIVSKMNEHNVSLIHDLAKQTLKELEGE